MRINRPAACLVVSCLLFALAAGAARVTAGLARSPGPQPAPPVATPWIPLPSTTSATASMETTLDPATVTAAVQAVEAAATVGALVIDRATGTELLAINPDRQFRSASLVKLLIAIDVLAGPASQTWRDRTEVMLRLSDDDIASALWSVGEGPAIVKRTSKLIGLTGIAPPPVPGQWGDVLLTPRDVGQIYQYVMTELPEADRALIVDALTRAPRRASDGFDQYFGIPDGLAGPWAIKQGWSNSATDIVLHTSGLVGADWRFVVVVLTEHPRSVNWRVAARSVTAGAKALSPLL